MITRVSRSSALFAQRVEPAHAAHLRVEQDQVGFELARPGAARRRRWPRRPGASPARARRFATRPCAAADGRRSPAGLGLGSGAFMGWILRRMGRRRWPKAEFDLPVQEGDLAAETAGALAHDGEAVVAFAAGIVAQTDAVVVDVHADARAAAFEELTRAWRARAWYYFKIGALQSRNR